MSIPLAVQLYTLRDALNTNFEGVMRQIAEMGYVGVELAGISAGQIYGTANGAAAALFRELGLQIPSAHLGLPYGEEQFEAAAIFGCQYIVVPWLPEDRFATEDDIKQVCDQLNVANAAVRAQGFTMAYHNHHWEFMPREDLGGRSPFDLMLELLDSAVQFELDTYWAKVGGSDPKTVLSEHKTRIPLVHVKDGPAVLKEPMVAAGEGVMDFPTVLAESPALWHIVELDVCATDMLEAVRGSYNYLVEKGLGHGR